MKYFIIGFISGIAAGKIRQQQGWSFAAGMALSVGMSLAGALLLAALGGCGTAKTSSDECVNVCFDAHAYTSEKYSCGCYRTFDNR